MTNKRFEHQKSVKRLLCHIYVDGFGPTRKRYGASMRVIERQITKFYPKSYEELSTYRKVIRNTSMRNAHYEDDKYLYIDVKGRIVTANLVFKSKILKHTWNSLTNGYIFTRINKRTVLIHHFLFGKKDGLVIDHKNRIKEDNRIKNIRFTSRSMNSYNVERKGVSGHRGVYYDKRPQAISKWYAQIAFNGKSCRIGSYETKEEAIDARIKKEIELFGHEVLL